MTKNAKGPLQETISSIRAQTFRHFEFVIVDGNSTDGTGEMVMKYQNDIHKYVSEPDSGIYDAMNKGIRYASGDYIFFLNAGDTFHDSFVLSKVDEIVNSKSGDLVYGDVLLMDEGREVLRNHAVVDKTALLFRTITHQALFARRGLFEEVGDFDLSFKLKADHDWILRCYNHHKTFQYIPIIISRYALNGYSVLNWNRHIQSDRRLLFKKNYSRIGVLVAKGLNRLGVLPPPNSPFRGIVNRLL